MTSVLHRNIAH